MKKHLLTVIACWLAAPAAADVSPIVFHEPCPKTVEEWLRRRDDFVDRYAIMSSKGYDGIGRWATDQLEYLKNCRKENLPLFTNNPGIDQCWAPVMEWLRALTPFQGAESGSLLVVGEKKVEKSKDQASWRLGMNKPDAEYYRLTSAYTEVPEDIRTNQEFLQAVAKPNNLPAAYAELDKINVARKAKAEPVIQYAPFKGNVTASVSRTLVRLMIYVPGNPAKWFSVGLPADDGTRTPQWSAVGVVTKNGESTVYFKDHWRQYDGAQDSHFETTFEEVKEGKFSDACWKCHKSGLISLPVDASMSEGDRKKTEAFNKVMEQTGLAGSGGFYDAAKLGPGLGGDDASEPGLAELREKLLPYCVADEIPNPEFGKKPEDFKKVWNRIDRTKILRAMNCSSCHDGVQRGRLTIPFGDILFRYIDEHRMPPGSKLSDEEKSILKGCLLKEFGGIASSAENTRLRNGDGTVSDSVPGPWYQGIEGVPAVPGLIRGRFALAFTKNRCTPKGAPAKPAEQKGAPKDKAGH